MTLGKDNETVEWRKNFEGFFSFVAKQRIESQA